MAPSKTIKVGSRGSALALRQDEEVLSLLRPMRPDLDFEVVSVSTQGDANPNASLTGLGLGVFVTEIERQLQEGLLDMAIHSLKDLPTQIPQDLALGAVLRRLDPRDVLVNRWDCSLAELPKDARIGTSSPRRQALLKSLCPQAILVPIRGNVETRLRKAQGEECDGAILAAAGMARLGLSQQITEYLSPQRFVPPPGQGALAVEVRADDDRMLELLRPIEHIETRLAVTAERAFLEKLGGGCQLPVGVYARCQGELMLMTLFICSPDGGKVFRSKLEGLALDPLQTANDAYLAVVERGGIELLDLEHVEQHKSGLEE
jgi:hydroxymethylbilane synthase